MIFCAIFSFGVKKKRANLAKFKHAKKICFTKKLLFIVGSSIIKALFVQRRKARGNSLAL